MKRFTLLLVSVAMVISSRSNAQSFALEAIKSYPFPTELTSAATGSRVAWAIDAQGKRNVYVAEGPAFTPRKLTQFDEDDAQEITSLQLSDDGRWVVFVRGGEHGANWDEQLPVNPASTLTPNKVQLYAVPFAGGEPKMLAEGDYPVISPEGTTVVFIRSGQVYEVPIDGSETAKSLFTTRGSVSSLRWSPNGKQLAFVSHRGDHSFIGIYTSDANTIEWISPSFHRDGSPRWSPDGSRIAFIRQSATGGVADSILVKRHQPWSIMVYQMNADKATAIWHAPKTLRGSVPTTHGGTNLHWASGDRIVFLSYQDGWPHLYSIATSGGNPLLLTPGSFMVEHVSLSADGSSLIFSANAGPDQHDLQRRHIGRVSVDKADMKILTPGEGLEWMPITTGDSESLLFFSATAQRPPLPAVIKLASPKGNSKPAFNLLGADLIPQNFPKELVTPKPVTFTAADGVTVHADLFMPRNKNGKRPAIVYVHGGPPRQMLLGWHYSDYYANAYALNQYLCSMGYVVLAVNYRLGIGYGYDFHQPARAGALGAAEYQDIKAAGEWLAQQPEVDRTRIGIYGGSYGGYLTALALAHDSDLFAAGVDIHGVHDYVNDRGHLFPNTRYDKAPDLEEAQKVAWQSSPISAVDKWRSPVLIIHADDDRNVRFAQSTDLVKRLERKGVDMETLVIVDDTHHWMKYSNVLRVNSAVADFFSRRLGR